MKKTSNREEKMSLVQQKLEEGVRDIFESDKYKEYMKTMSRFPRYSINNCILIACQCPEEVTPGNMYLRLRGLLGDCSSATITPSNSILL